MRIGMRLRMTMITNMRKSESENEIGTATEAETGTGRQTTARSYGRIALAAEIHVRSVLHASENKTHTCS